MAVALTDSSANSSPRSRKSGVLGALRQTGGVQRGMGTTPRRFPWYSSLRRVAPVPMPCSARLLHGEFGVRSGQHDESPDDVSGQRALAPGAMLQTLAARRINQRRPGRAVPCTIEAH